MRFLAGESCDFALVRALRSAGHDVVAMTDALPGAPDEQVLRHSVRERRILLTEDKDFGQWVYAHRHPTVGVVLFRYHVHARQEILSTAVRLAQDHAERLAGSFVVVQVGRVRIRSIPPPPRRSRSGPSQANSK